MAAGGPCVDQVVADDAGGAGAVLQRRRVVVEPHDFGKLRLDLLDHQQNAARAARRHVLDAARHDAVHHQPMPERAVGGRQHPLAENAAMGMDQRERRVVADRADVAEMVGDALELGHDAAQDLCARRRLDLERRLDGARESKAVGDGGIAGDARDHAARPARSRRR